ncbi:hypothetical protein C8R42DRAFT_736983 [Lentinula raphanica]|nr:hypothetical protein C8R42DRAFT_736983 [Lentinula raphanica]
MATLTPSHPKDKKLTYIITVPKEGILYIRPTALSVPRVIGLSTLEIEEHKDHKATEVKPEDELLIFIRLEGHPAMIIIQQDQEIKLNMHSKCNPDKLPDICRMNDLKRFKFDGKVNVFGFQKERADVLLRLHSDEKAAGCRIVSHLVLADYLRYAKAPILAKTCVGPLFDPDTSLQGGKFMCLYRGKHPLESRHHDFYRGTNATQALEGSDSYLVYLPKSTIDPKGTEFEVIMNTWANSAKQMIKDFEYHHDHLQTTA